MDREKLKEELSKFRNEQCSHIDAFHYSAITCDDCVVNFIDRILTDETRELRDKLVVETARRLYWERCDENDTPRLFWDNLWDHLSSTRPALHRISKPYWIEKARAALKEAR